MYVHRYCSDVRTRVFGKIPEASATEERERERYTVVKIWGLEGVENWRNQMKSESQCEAVASSYGVVLISCIN